MTMSIPHFLLLRPILIVLLTILSSSSFNSAASTGATYNVVSFGAKPDGKTDCTKAFLSAWQKACGSAQPAMIYVPAGRFLLGKVVFGGGECSNKAITVTIDGTLVAPSNYHGNDDSNWILFDNVDGVSVRGGLLDGQGTSLWACKNSGGNCPTGATSLEFTDSKNIVVAGLTSLNSQMFHIVIHQCQHVKMQGLKVTAPGNSPNTDGIHIGGSDDVTILSSNIQTGDDCVSVGPGTTNLWVENVACGPGHGISIGSLGRNQNEEGVQNVTVKTVKFTGTDNGVRIKTWGKPSNAFVKNVLFQHAAMVDVANPIVIDQNYCPDHGCPNQAELAKGLDTLTKRREFDPGVGQGVGGGILTPGCLGKRLRVIDGSPCPTLVSSRKKGDFALPGLWASGVKISDATYQDIHGTSATEVAVKFDCSSKNPCSGIKLKDVKLTYNKKIAEAYCQNAGGTSQGYVQPESCL